jgi:hypothetical protein
MIESNFPITYDLLHKLNIDPENLLHGQYESMRLPKDFSSNRIVPDFAFNLLNQYGLNYRPILDEAYINNGGLAPKWPGNKKFAACLTHDVDDVTLYSIRQCYRGRLSAIKNANNIKSRLRNISGFTFDIYNVLKSAFQKDPLHCYEKWLNIENSVNARSTFFFWPGLKSVKKRHFSDCTYELNDKIIFDGQKCTVIEMIKEIHSRGWEIGLHPSWYSFDDYDELRRQKNALDNALGQEVLSVRQHQLHFDIRKTSSIQSKVGLKYDSTLGFNDNLGFRNGTSYPWQLNNYNSDSKLNIIEIPLIIQDAAMLSTVKGMRLDENIAFEYVKQIINSIEKVGGVATLLWHPNVIIFPEWWQLYVKSIEYLNEKDAWFGTVQQVGNIIADKNHTQEIQ